MGTDRNRRLVAVVGLTAALAAGLAARSTGLGDRGLWFDEAYTWRVATRSVAEQFELTTRDNNPPLHYLLTGAWVRAFGDSAISLRAQSVGWGLLAVVGTFLFTRAALTGPLAGRVTGREVTWAPVLAAGFVALSPLQVRYGWEARMYAQGAALAALSGWAMVRAMDPDQPNWGRWLGFAGVATLFAYTHTFALLSLACQAGFVGWWLCERVGGSPRRAAGQPAFAPAAVAFGLVAVGFSPWLPVLASQVSEPATRQWIVPLTSPAQVFDLCHQLVVGPSDPGPAGEGAATRVGLAVLALAGVAAARRRWADGVMLALGLGPVVLAVVLSLAGVQVMVARYLLFAQVFLLAGLAVAVARVRHPALFVAAAVTALTAHGYWCLDHWKQTDLANRPGYRGAAEYLDAARAAGEPVLCSHGLSYLPVMYHLRNRDRVWTVAHPEGWVVADWALDLDREVVRAAHLDRVSGRRVWVVSEIGADAERYPFDTPAGWRAEGTAEFRNVFGMNTVTVTAYTTAAAAAH